MYILEFSTSSKKELKTVDKSSQAFILDSLEDFINKFSPDYEISLMHRGKVKKLQGQKEEFYRLKLRSYRVICKKYDDKLVILIIHITTRESADK